MKTDIEKKVIDFNHEELNCFLRAQAEVCRKYGEWYDLIFIFMTSLHKAYDINGYYYTPGKKHFDFLKDHFETFSNIEFEIEYIPGESEVLSTIERKLEKYKDIIVPINLKGLYYSEHYNKNDWAHFLIVNSYENNILKIYDHLHLDNFSNHIKYSSFVLSEDIFDNVKEKYWRSHVSNDDICSNTFHGDSRYWVLNIKRGDLFTTITKESFRKSLIEIYKKSVIDAGREKDIYGIDEYYLSNLNSYIKDKKGSNFINSYMRKYLSEVNFSNLHKRILNEVIFPECKDLKDITILNNKKSKSIRSKIMFSLLSNKNIPELSIIEAANSLKILDKEYRKKLLDLTSI